MTDTVNSSRIAESAAPPARPDRGEFRRALGKFPTGVAVITTRSETGAPIGVTCNSFNSVSLDPPLVIWSLRKAAHSRQIFESGKYWGVNVLSASQKEISDRFSRAGEDKFASMDYDDQLFDTPLLPDCCARFICETDEIIDGGDHIIFIGKVVYFDSEDFQPLVFFSGRYDSLAGDVGNLRSAG